MIHRIRSHSGQCHSNTHFHYTELITSVSSTLSMIQHIDSTVVISSVRCLYVCGSEAVILIWFDYFAFSFLEYQVFWYSHTRRKKIKSIRFISKFDYLKINLWKQNNFFLYLITSRKKIIEKFFVPFCISNSYTSTNRMATAAAAAAAK